MLGHTPTHLRNESLRPSPCTWCVARRANAAMREDWVRRDVGWASQTGG